MGPVLTALRTLGVRVEEHGEPGHLPFTVHGRGRLAGGQVDIDASESSQFVSGLLLAAARFERGLTLRHTGRTLPSLPHIEMTVALLREAGVEVDDSRPAIWQVAPGPIAGRDVRVEPDLSNAAPFLCAALVAGGSVRVPGWPPQTTQPGGLLPGILERMGATHQPGRRRAHRTRDGRDPRRRPRPARRGRDRPDDRRAGRTGRLPHPAARHRAPARARDRPARGSRGRDHARRRAGGADLGRPGHHAAAADRRRLAHVRGPPHGDRGRPGRPARPGIEVEDVATTAKTLPDFVGLWSDMLLGTRTPA